MLCHCSETLLTSFYFSTICVRYSLQGPAELPSDWGKNPHGPDEEKLNQRQVIIIQGVLKDYIREKQLCSARMTTLYSLLWIMHIYFLRFTVMVTYSFHLYSRSSHIFILSHSSFHGLMNSKNWPASSVWVFIVQVVEHCSANAEATSNPVEAPKTFFSGYFAIA